jgi:hypothetical protein
VHPADENDLILHRNLERSQDLPGSNLKGRWCRARRNARQECSAMKMSHLANFLMMIVGGAVQEVSSAVRRKLRGVARAD